MTLKQLIKLAKKGREWKLEDELEIRCSNGLCPIIAAFCNKFPHDPQPRSWMYDVAGKRLGLDSELAERIASAADCNEGSDLVIRAELLKGLGLV